MKKGRWLRPPLPPSMAVCKKRLKKYSGNKFFHLTMALAGPVLKNCTKTENTRSSRSSSKSRRSSSSGWHLGWVSLTRHGERDSDLKFGEILKYSSKEIMTSNLAKWVGNRRWLAQVFQSLSGRPRALWIVAATNNGWWIIFGSHCGIINCGESVRTGEKWIVS